MELLFIDLDSPMYRLERDLRWRVLRQPLGRPPGSEEFPFEARCLHLIALDEAGAAVGCVLFLPDEDDPARGRLLQMAVAPERQGQGLGRRLVRHLERRLARDGVREVTLHARDHAIGFYERLGYACYGEPYEEVGIPHRHMRRSL